MSKFINFILCLSTWFCLSLNLLNGQTNYLFSKCDTTALPVAVKNKVDSLRGISSALFTHVTRFNHDAINLNDSVLVSLIEENLLLRKSVYYQNTDLSRSWVGTGGRFYSAMNLTIKDGSYVYGYILHQDFIIDIKQLIGDYVLFSYRLRNNDTNEETCGNTFSLSDLDTSGVTEPLSGITAEKTSEKNRCKFDCVIRLLVAYTHGVEREYNSPEDIKYLVNSLISDLNAAYSNSLINFRAELAVLVKTPLTDWEDSGVNLEWFQQSPSIRTIRDDFRADACMLLTKSGSAGGKAFSLSPGSINDAYATMLFNNDGKTFAHEIAHLQGCWHDTYSLGGPRFVLEILAGANYPFGYVDMGRNFRDMMAYDDECTDNGVNCPRILYFSHPPLYGNPVCNNARRIRERTYDLAAMNSIYYDFEVGDIDFNGYVDQYGEVEDLFLTDIVANNNITFSLPRAFYEVPDEKTRSFRAGNDILFNGNNLLAMPKGTLSMQADNDIIFREFDDNGYRNLTQLLSKNAVFKASNDIRLENDFSVKNGANFTAEANRIIVEPGFFAERGCTTVLTPKRKKSINCKEPITFPSLAEVKSAFCTNFHSSNPICININNVDGLKYQYHLFSLFPSTLSIGSIGVVRDGKICIGPFDLDGGDNYSDAEFSLSISILDPENYCLDWAETYEFSGNDDCFRLGLIKSDALESIIKFYPNPTTGEVWLKAENGASAKATAEILDVTGRVVLPARAVSISAGVSAEPLDVSALASGVYLLKITTGGTASVSKLIIRKD